MRTRHAYGIGDTVRIGTGSLVWTITGFFGEHSDIAALTCTYLGTYTTTARFDQLHKAVNH